MAELDLTDQQNVLPKKLSGGQRRKLSTGIALIGDPKVNCLVMVVILVHSTALVFFRVA